MNAQEAKKIADGASERAQQELAKIYGLYIGSWVDAIKQAAEAGRYEVRVTIPSMRQTAPSVDTIAEYACMRLAAEGFVTQREGGCLRIAWGEHG